MQLGKFKFLIPLVIFLLLAGFLAVGLKLDPRRVPSPLIGKPAPAFSLPDFRDPRRVIHSQNLWGTPVLLNVWASWCSSCRQEHRALTEIAKKTETKIIGLDYKDSRPEAERWLETLGNPYDQILFDQDGRTAIDWGVYGVPETFLIDSGGVIIHKFTGPLTVEVFENEFLPLIQKDLGR